MMTMVNQIWPNIFKQAVKIVEETVMNRLLFHEGIVISCA